MRSMLLALCLLAALAGCGGDRTPAVASRTTQQDAQARVGDVAVHATVVQTSTLDEAVARQYGLERSDRIAMLLVSARRDGDAPLPPGLKIAATVSDGTGMASKRVVLRPVTVGGLVDHVGTVEIAPPESLRFDVVVTYGTASSTVQFTRDFYPR